MWADWPVYGLGLSDEAIMTISAIMRDHKISTQKTIAMARLTKPLLDAIESALNSALAGEGWDGGDFDGQNPEHFERALEWVREQKKSREGLRSENL